MRNKLNNINFSSIVFFLCQEMFLGVGLTQILLISKQNSIYVCFIGLLFSLIYTLFLLSYFNYLPNLNLFEKINYTYKKLGKIINFILFIVLFIYLTYSLFLLSVYIQNKYLTNTPKLLIITLFLLPTVYLANSNIKSISKTSFILLIISVFEYIIMFSGIIKYINLENFKPLFDKNIKVLLKSSFYYMSYLSFPLFLILFVPKSYLQKPDKINKNIIIFFSLCNFFIFLLTFGIIGVFGIDLSLLFDFPGYSLTKKINFFDFIQHIENLVSSVWMLGMLFNSVMCIYSIKLYVNKKYYYPLIILSLFTSSFLFKNSNLLFIFIRKYFIYLFLFIIILLIKRNKN